MSAAKEGNLCRGPDFLSRKEERLNENQCEPITHEGNIENNVTKNEISQAADSMMSSAEDQRTDVAFRTMNGEVEMEEENVLKNVGHSIVSAQPSSHVEDNVKPADGTSNVAVDPSTSDITEPSGKAGGQVESSMDVDNYSTSSQGEIHSSSITPSLVMAESETSDSRDSFSAGGRIEIESAMEVDVVTSVSQDNQFKVITSQFFTHPYDKNHVKFALVVHDKFYLS